MWYMYQVIIFVEILFEFLLNDVNNLRQFFREFSLIEDLFCVLFVFIFSFYCVFVRYIGVVGCFFYEIFREQIMFLCFCYFLWISIVSIFGVFRWIIYRWVID